jgi:hypothetical protein
MSLLHFITSLHCVIIVGNKEITVFFVVLNALRIGGKTFRGNHKGYDNLDTVITLITTVTKSGLILRIKVCITLKIGARQVLEQHLEPSTEEILPIEYSWNPIPVRAATIPGNVRRGH